MGRDEFGKEDDDIEESEHPHGGLGQAMAAEFPPDQLPLPGAIEVFRLGKGGGRAGRRFQGESARVDLPQKIVDD